MEFIWHVEGHIGILQRVCYIEHNYKLLCYNRHCSDPEPEPHTEVNIGGALSLLRGSDSQKMGKLFKKKFLFLFLLSLKHCLSSNIEILQL